MNENIPDQTPLASPVNDIRKLKRNAAASSEELLQWISQLKGRSPREVLGEVAKSHLFRCCIESSFFYLLIIAGWTGASWGWAQYKQGSNPPPAAAPAETREAAPKPAAAAAATNAPAAPAAPAPAVANPDKAQMPDLSPAGKSAVANKLGIGEVKEAPANVNPLDKNDDDLLKGLK